MTRPVRVVAPLYAVSNGMAAFLDTKLETRIRRVIMAPAPFTFSALIFGAISDEPVDENPDTP